MTDATGNTAMTCPECGATGQTESFCTECGEFLRWQRGDQPPKSKGTPSTTPASSAPPAVDPRLAHGLPTIPPVGEPVADNPYRTTSPAPVAGATGPDLHHLERQEEPPTEEVPPYGEIIDRTERARALIVPVQEPTAGQSEPETPAGPVLPGRADQQRPRRVRRLAPEEEPYDGVACPVCGTVNPESRHYCRRCAALLTVTGHTETPPWWRRIFRRGAKGPERIPMAGERPRLRGLRARWPVWAVRAAIAVAVVVCLVLYTGQAVNAIEDHFTHPVPIHAQTITASHSDPGHKASNLDDGYNNTWWGDGVAGNGGGQYITADFGRPVHLLDLGITPGTSTQQDVYFQQARPLEMEVTLYHADNTTTVQRITLDDRPGFQVFSVRGSDVQMLRLTLESAYGASAKTEVAIAELEFFGRSTAGTADGTGTTG
ncbi:NADase-type glycan-binding domain-containing protein [Streptomyces sp. RPT161]|uniref:NADase-type glycan-binding domain-containing protein n=1 Tax=Streptomyces sp. RPT161 TaxID=3015993 RepID=UPI0022B8672B|nr:hypothetical protein [Streptomyces sp. RPT161]